MTLRHHAAAQPQRRAHRVVFGLKGNSLDISANDFQMLDPRPDRAAMGDTAQPARAAAGGEKFDPDEIPF